MDIKLNSHEDRILNELLNDLQTRYQETFYTDFHFSLFADDKDFLTSIEFSFRSDLPRNQLIIELSGKTFSQIKDEIKEKLFSVEPSRFN